MRRVFGELGEWIYGVARVTGAVGDARKCEGMYGADEALGGL